MSVSTKALFAMTGQQLLVAGMPNCSSAGNPTDCLSVSNTAGNPTCTWLMLSGSCADAFGSEAVNSPATCCSSQAEGSACKHQSAFLPDGSCSVPSGPSPNSRMSSRISLDEMTYWLHFAYAIYCPESEINNWNCGAHCDAISGLRSISYQKEMGWTDNIEHASMVAYDPAYGEIVVSLKGTDNDAAFIENWMTNLDFFKKNPLSQYPNAWVHGGFWDAWLSLKDDVLPAIQRVQAEHSTNRIKVVGHSLGAAMATNAAMDLKLNHGFVTSVVNFGSPRAGDHEYHEAVLKEVPHWRVTHNNDLVAHLPPESVGFYHASTEIHFPDSHGLNFKFCDGSGEDNSCANACSYWLTCTSIDDHMHYLDETMTCASSSSVVV